MSEWIGGRPTTEAQRKEQTTCESFKVFLEVSGFFSVQKKEITLGKGATALDAQHKVGNPPVDSRIVSGDGKKVGQNDFLWQHSKDCTLSLKY
jgi:hypothetical protein